MYVRPFRARQTLSAKLMKPSGRVFNPVCGGADGRTGTAGTVWSTLRASLSGTFLQGRMS